MKSFLEERLPKKIGDILDVEGKKLGVHEGAHFYTIGQRKGIEIGGGPALFVIQKNVLQNTITVGSESTLQLFHTVCIGKEWQAIVPGRKIPKDVTIKLRYRQVAEAGVIAIDNSMLTVTFPVPQRAPTPGQFIVVYDEDEVL